MKQLCPVCAQPLMDSDGGFYCAFCETAFQQQACCPDCAAPLQVLKACGAVDYFCQRHGLISKKRVLFLPLSME